MSQKPTISLGKNASMRDVGDYCKKHGIPSLAQGMIELPPPKKLRELAAQYAVSDEIHQYRDRYGEPIYLQGIQSLLKQHYGITVSQSNLMATHGVTGSCITALMYLRYENKNRIGLVSPFYTYHLKECQAVFSKDPTFIPMFDYENLLAPLNFTVLEDALKEGLDCIIVCNPSNPTGRVWTKQELTQVVALCKQYNCMILLDECYCDMVWEPNHFFTPLPPYVDAFPENIIVCRGFSKVLGCQSWRAGYVVAHESIIPKMMVIHDPIYVCVPWVQHALGDFLLNHYDVFKSHCVEIGKLMRSNWSKLKEAFKQYLEWEPVEPQGTMYGMFKHKSETDMDAIIKGLEKGVGCVPCTLFFPGFNQQTGYVRIHCGVVAEKADTIVKALKDNSQ